MWLASCAAKVDAIAIALAAVGVQEETGVFLGFLEVFILLGS
jgi:hypothetical protein